MHKRKRLIKQLSKLGLHRFLSVPKKLPPELKHYQAVYSMFLKHCVRGRKLQGALFEIGPAEGKLLDFFHRKRFFFMNPRFTVTGVESSKRHVDFMSKESRENTVISKIENLIKNREMQNSADFIIANQLIGSPNVDTIREHEKFLKALSRLTKKNGKVFIASGKINGRISKRLLQETDFRIIDYAETNNQIVEVLEKK